jgi:hypothetical protein
MRLCQVLDKLLAVKDLKRCPFAVGIRQREFSGPRSSAGGCSTLLPVWRTPTNVAGVSDPGLPYPGRLHRGRLQPGQITDRNAPSVQQTLPALPKDLTHALVVSPQIVAMIKLPVLATIAAALPVLALMRLLGGIDPGALGGSFAVIVGPAMLVIDR